MGATFSRVKTWVSTEDVTYSDLNAEFDNILNNLTAAGVDDFSANVSQMQTTVDPGEVGTESLATSVAGELSRLRHLILEITGEDEWYESPVSSIIGLANAIGSGLSSNRLVSGRVRTGSQQPTFLVPNGAARTVKLDGAPTSFIYYVDGIGYTIDADTTLTNLTAAPSSQNTCLVNDANAADQDWTKYAGEYGTEITIDNIGTEISSLVGKLAGFKLDNGATTEYFIAEIGTNKLSRAKRGYFFDSTDAPIPRIVFSNNDTITLMKLTWIFAKSDETLTATYNPPVWGKDEPSSPALGDYWFDTDNNIWKVYGVGSFSAASATLVGVCIQDTSNTVGARSFEFFGNYTATNTVELSYSSATTLKALNYGSQINVWGTTIKNEHGIWTWDITADRDSGVSETSSTYYFFYITEEGDKIISDIRPYDRQEDLYGFYHPHHSWRCVGSAFNNSSSDLADVNSYFHRYEGSRILTSQTAAINIDLSHRVIPVTSAGGAFTIYLPPAALTKGQILEFIKTNTATTAVTLDGYGSETIGGSTTYGLYTNGEVLKIISDGSNWLVLYHRTETAWVDSGVNTITATTANPTKGVNTLDKVWWRRQGDSAQIRIEYAQTGAGSAGTGDYLFLLPLTIDSSKVTMYATVEGGVGGWVNAGSMLGYGTATEAARVAAALSVVPYDTTKIRLLGMSDFDAGCIGSGYNGLSVAGQYYQAIFTVPISGWQP
jgi:hypothetical protein